jgi:hypothetical protein
LRREKMNDQDYMDRIDKIEEAIDGLGIDDRLNILTSVLCSLLAGWSSPRSRAIAGSHIMAMVARKIEETYKVLEDE